MSWMGQIGGVVHKELLVEWRDRSRISGLFFYSATLLLMVAFAMPSTSMLERVGPGMMWLGILLASTRSLDQSLRVEMENDCIEGLVLWPVSPIAIYYGKAIANTVVLLAVALTVLPLMMLLYHPVFQGSWCLLVATLVLGSAGLAAPGTLVAALTVRARGSSALLPMLFLPLVVPVLLSCARATSLLFEGDPMQQADDWIARLLLFDVLHWAMDGLLFARVVDEG